MRDRVALVTGASSGIGRAIALELHERGATVWLVGRRTGALAEVAEAAGAGGSRLHLCRCDLTDDTDVAGLAREVEEAGRLDVLVHSAAEVQLGRVEEASADALDAQYRVNLRAPALLTKALLPLLKAKGGDVVFVNSTAALHPGAGVGHYAATKAALRALADSLRAEVNDESVRVLSVFPGRTATPGQARIHAHEGKELRPELLMQPEDVARMVVAGLDLPRTAEVMELTLRPFVKPA